MEKNIYDVLICGGGPSGLSAGIYSARGGLKVALLEKLYAGGQATLTYEIENYPGFLSIGGSELAMKMEEQAIKCGVNMIYDEVVSLSVSGAIKTVKTMSSGELQAKTVILAMGAKPRPLDVDGEQKFLGRGVSYCATCDGALYKDKTVAVIGGGNTAVEDAIYLTRFAKKVYIVHRRKEFRASQTLVDALKNSGVKLVLDGVVDKLMGEKRLEKMVVKNVISNEVAEYDVDGVFVAVGQLPEKNIVDGIIDLDESGYVICDEAMKTNVEGVYCCGDLRKKQLRQIITACADGAIAGESAISYCNLGK